MAKKPTARRSQLVSTYGVGGLFPAENASLMIAGFDHWSAVRAPYLRPNRASPAHSACVGYYSPPAGGTKDVPVIRFPLWQTCSSCNRIGKPGLPGILGSAPLRIV